MAYLQAADAAVTLLRDPATAAAWERPSALTEFRVSGLAGHLAGQILAVPDVLATEVPDEPPIALFDHYTSARWIGADVDADINVRIRESGEATAVDGAAALANKCEQVLVTVREAVLAEPPDRVVHLAGRWSLTLDDYLTTRTLELAVHADDLAVSVDVPTPALPDAVLGPVFALLTGLAVRRHGSTALLRALSRAERAPASIAAI